MLEEAKEEQESARNQGKTGKNSSYNQNLSRFQTDSLSTWFKYVTSLAYFDYNQVFAPLVTADQSFCVQLGFFWLPLDSIQFCRVATLLAVFAATEIIPHENSGWRMSRLSDEDLMPKRNSVCFEAPTWPCPESQQLQNAQLSKEITCVVNMAGCECNTYGIKQI